jgi:xylulokinase
VCETSRRSDRKTGIVSTDIAAVSFSGQMMGVPVRGQERHSAAQVHHLGGSARPAQQRALGEKIPQREFYGIVGHRNAASYG